MIRFMAQKRLDGGAPRFRILVVCTGNICRSPAGELLLRRELDDSVAVSSAGTRGMPAWPVSEPMAALLLADGVPGEQLTAFHSEFLTEPMVAAADLIIAMSAAHRSQVLELDPLALRRTFTLGELSRLAARDDIGRAIDFSNDDDDAARMARLVMLANAARRLARGGASDDVPDPYGRGAEEYAESYRQIKGHIGAVMAAVRALE